MTSTAKLGKLNILRTLYIYITTDWAIFYLCIDKLLKFSYEFANFKYPK